MSIVAVIWHHAGGQLGGILGQGHLGVSLFFVISGFLITTLLLREGRARGAINLRNFYARRALRIFPLYFAVVALYVVLVTLTERNSAAGLQFYANLPYFVSYTSNWFVDLDSGSRVIFYFAWSLATEEQFYLVWPWVLRFGRSRFGAPAVMAVLLVVDQGLEWAGVAGLVPRDALWRRIATSVATPICLGSLGAFVLDRGTAFSLLWPWLGPRWSTVCAFVVLAGLIAVPESPQILIFLAMTWLVLACCVREDHRLAPLLGAAPIQYLGVISYGMYLLHMIGINATRRIFPGASEIIIFVGGLLLTIVFASLSYRFFERRFLMLKDSFGLGSARPSTSTKVTV